MNKRIKEVSEEAKEYAMRQNYSGYAPLGFMDYYTEKLARLIIDKCCDMADAKQIKEYFYET